MMKLTGAGEFLKKIPWQLYAVFVVVLTIGITGCVHLRNDKKEVAAADLAGYNRAMAKVRLKALRIERAANALEAKITAPIRSQVDADNRADIERSSALLMRGPGRAACVLSTPLPVSPSGHDQAGGGAGVAPTGMLGSDRIAVPFDYAVKDETIDDANRREVLAWRSWHKSFTEEWAKLNAIR